MKKINIHFQESAIIDVDLYVDEYGISEEDVEVDIEARLAEFFYQIIADYEGAEE
jgi:hypothetical protein